MASRAPTPGAGLADRDAEREDDDGGEDDRGDRQERRPRGAARRRRPPGRWRAGLRAGSRPARRGRIQPGCGAAGTVGRAGRAEAIVIHGARTMHHPPAERVAAPIRISFTSGGAVASSTATCRAQRSTAARSRCSVKLDRESLARTRRPAPRWCGWSDPANRATSRGPIRSITADQVRRHVDRGPVGQRLEGPGAKSHTGIDSSCALVGGQEGMGARHPLPAEDAAADDRGPVGAQVADRVDGLEADRAGRPPRGRRRSRPRSPAWTRGAWRRRRAPRPTSQHLPARCRRRTADGFAARRRPRECRILAASPAAGSAGGPRRPRDERPARPRPSRRAGLPAQRSPGAWPARGYRRPQIPTSTRNQPA